MNEKEEYLTNILVNKDSKGSDLLVQDGEYFGLRAGDLVLTHIDSTREGIKAIVVGFSFDTFFTKVWTVDIKNIEKFKAGFWYADKEDKELLESNVKFLERPTVPDLSEEGLKKLLKEFSKRKK